MIAPAPNYIAGQSTESTAYRNRAPWELNTPYTKSTSRNKTSFHFEKGFYQQNQVPIPHPVEVIIKNEWVERAISLIKRFDALLPQFEQWVEPTVLDDAVSRLATLLFNEPFERIVLEKTPDESLLIKACWKGMNVYIDLDFNTDEPEDYETQISVYNEQQSVLAVAGPFDFAVKHLLNLPTK